MMTRLQKEILWHLLNGSSIAIIPGQSYRLRDTSHRPIRKFSNPTFSAIRYLLRKNETGLFVINKNLVRQQRGNAWIKKAYRLINNTKTNSRNNE